MISGTSSILEINERFSLRLEQDRNQRLGDSLGLQKGLIMFVGSEPVCGEGVGFGVPAVEYPDQIMFSTTATLVRNEELEKIFSIDALQRKTWKDKFTVDNRVYRTVQGILADAYRTDARFRPTLTQLMQIQSMLGVKLSHQRIKSKGFVKVGYHKSGNEVVVTVDSSQLFDKRFTRLYIFNEQSADFDVYEDDSGTLRDEKIGVWEEVKSQRASLTNRKLNVTFCIKNIAGAKLFRGRELLKPRLNWAGFCYSIPPHMEYFNYTLQIT